MDIMTVRILSGNFLLAACCIAYLAWWSVAFRPGYSAAATLQVGLFAVTAVLGIAGFVQVVRGCMAASGEVRYMGIIAGGVVAYFLLLFLSSAFLHRQVTTELMLIVLWTCTELCACRAMLSGGAHGSTGFAGLAAVILVAAAAGLICYLKYYDLAPMTAFYDGMVPLVLFGVVMIGIDVWFLVR